MRSPRSEHLLALGAVAIIVPQTNDLPRLSRHVLKQIFTCEITDWTEVPGARGLSGPIHVYTPDERSGAWDTFEEVVMGGASSCPAKRAAPSDQLDPRRSPMTRPESA